MNNINFTARLSVAKDKTFPNYSKRGAAINRMFKQQTKNSPNDILFVDDFNKGEFSIGIDKKKERSQTFNFGDPQKMTNEQLTKRLVDVFDILKLKAQQEISIENLKALRKKTYETYQKRIEEQEAKGSNVTAMRFIQLATRKENSRTITSLKRIYDIDLNSLMISKNLSNKF